MDISKRLFYSNALYYFIGIVGGGLINFFSIPLIIEKYGVEKYGNYSLIQNVILIIISFGSGWLNQNILRFNNGSQIFKSKILSFYYLTLLPLFLVSLFLILILRYNFLIAIISSFTVTIGCLTAIMNTFYQSNLNAKKNVLFDLFRVIGFVGCVYIFSFFDQNKHSVMFLIVGFFISYLIAFVLKLRSDFSQLLIIFENLRKNFNVVKLKKFLRENKYLFDYGWPLSLWFTVSSVLNVGDRYVINMYLSKSDLGNYSAIYDLLYKGVSISFTPILAAGYPIISKFYNNNQKNKAYLFIKRLVIFEIFILLIAVMVAIQLDEFFLEKIVRLEYTRENAKLVPLILIGAIIWQICMLIHKPLELKLKTKAMLSFAIASLILNLTLNFIFIPKFGLIAAAYNSIIGVALYLILNLGYIIINRKWDI